jgi:hypothetical protein
VAQSHILLHHLCAQEIENQLGTCWVTPVGSTIAQPHQPNAWCSSSSKRWHHIQRFTMLAGLPMYIPTSPQFYMLLFSRTCGQAYELERMMRRSYRMRLVNLLGYTPSISYYSIYKIWSKVNIAMLGYIGKSVNIYTIKIILLNHNKIYFYVIYTFGNLYATPSIP